MKILKVLFFLSFVTHLNAQVKTITLRKAEPYDTQHVTLVFTNEKPVMPKFPGGKNGFDLSVVKAYNTIVNKTGVYEAPKDNGENTGDTIWEDQAEVFYEGRVLDRARFVNIKTYCDTDGTLIILPQDLTDPYTMAAVKIVRLMPKLIPAKYDEENVPVYLTIPIRFLKEVDYTPNMNIKSAVKKKGHSRLWWFFYRILHPFGDRFW